MDNQNIVFVSGMFNILHPGHFRLLKYAAEQGSKLIVGVFPDEQNPHITVGEEERLQNLMALSFVDEAFILTKNVEEYISEIKPDIIVKGWEHHDKENPEKKAIESYGGRIIFSSGDIKISGFSSLENNNELSAFKTISKPQGFMKRHNFNAMSLQNILTKFESLNVCVIGDIIVDNYVNCQAVGMSREDPTIVVRPADSTLYLGGAGIVAAHASGLGAQVHFISVSGNDDAGEFSKEKLKEYGVNSHIFIDESRPTTQKKRYRANGKTMLRVNEYSDHPISTSICDLIMDKLQHLIYDIDVIIFSDFSYGMLPQNIVDNITVLANKHNITIAADSQTSSQVGNIARFSNVSLITPTEHEARTSTKNFADGLVSLSEKIRETTNAHNVVITLAEEGLFISGNNHENIIVNDRLPALQKVASDPAGAGDALLVTMAMTLATGGNIWEATYLGALSSALQVSRIGNIPLKYETLFEVLSS